MDLKGNHLILMNFKGNHQKSYDFHEFQRKSLEKLRFHNSAADTAEITSKFPSASTSELASNSAGHQMDVSTIFESFPIDIQEKKFSSRAMSSFMGQLTRPNMIIRMKQELHNDDVQQSVGDPRLSVSLTTALLCFAIQAKSQIHTQ